MAETSTTSSALTAAPRDLLGRTGRAYPRHWAEFADGARVAYVETGEGEQAVILIHGTLTTLDDMLLALGDHLSDRRVIAIDRPGFGFSDRRLGEDAGVFRQAARLVTMLENLDVSRATLVGHSFGASVAIAMALLRPERVRGVVALAPLAWPEWRLEHLLFGPRATPIVGPAVAEGLHASLDRLLLPALWRGMFLPQALPARLETEFPFAKAGDAASTIRVGEDSVAVGADLTALLMRAATLSTPLHVLAGTRDLVVNNSLHGQVLAALAPKGRMSWLAGVGHMLHHAAPAEVAQAVRELVES